MSGNYVLSNWIPLYPGISRAIGNQSFSNTGLSQQWANVLRVDLSSANISFLTTPSHQLQVNGVTAREFLQQNFYSPQAIKGAVAMLATNANFFDMGHRSTLQGYAVSNGAVTSPPSLSSPWVLCLSDQNKASIRNIPSQSNVPGDIWNAVAGNYQLCSSGKNVAPLPPPPSTNTAPIPYVAARTAAGCSPANGSIPPYLYMLTIDGLESKADKPGSQSYGGTLHDTAQWLLLAGAQDGINLDGGGSTTMARIDFTNSHADLVNVPHGDEGDAGIERPVGNCLGVIVH